MYLRLVKERRGYHFVLRESVRRDDHWESRDLLDLGDSPEDYIELPGGNGFYFRSELEDALEEHGVHWETDELEEIFLPFLPPHIQRILNTFGVGSSTTNRWSGCSDELLIAEQRHLHSFDKRRLHYLRCGRVDIGNLEGRCWKFLNVLLEKSRDEIEHVIDQMESQLRPHEIKPYIFTALNLQSYFSHHLFKNQPAALDAEKVDGFFLDAICSLNSDHKFFKGVPTHSEEDLHPYLVKYVIRYFDYSFHAPRFLDESVRRFFWQRQFTHRPPARSRMDVQQACDCLEISRDDFEKMRARDLVKCYRSKAMAAHPDRGGDHDTFIRLTEAYECLVVCKRSEPRPATG